MQQPETTTSELLEEAQAAGLETVETMSRMKEVLTKARRTGMRIMHRVRLAIDCQPDNKNATQPGEPQPA